MGLCFPTLAQNDELCDDINIRGFRDWYPGMGELQNNFKKRPDLLTIAISEAIFSAQVYSFWRFFCLYVKGVDDERH